MKTYNEFMEQYSGREMGKTNDLASETMARRKENERAAEQRRKEAEQKRKEREQEAERKREESLKEFTVPGFDGKRITVTKKPIRMIDGKMAKAFPGRGTEGDGPDGSADGNGDGGE